MQPPLIWGKRMKTKVRAVSLMLIFALIIPCLLFWGGVDAVADDYSWVGAWHASPVKTSFRVAGTDITPILTYTTTRTVITLTTGGDNLRLCFTNKYGDGQAKINKVYVSQTDPNDESSTLGDFIPVTFSGSKTVVLGKGFTYSDPVPMKVEPLQKISISIYYTIPSYVGTAALYGGTTYIAAANQVKGKKLIAPAKLKLDVSGMTFYPIPYLTSVDVDNDNAYSVVMLGDSTLNNEVPLLLAEKLVKNGTKNVGVLQSSIAGNRLLYDGYGNGALGTLYGDSALKRFDDDALRQAGVAKIFVKVGLNDVLHPRTKSMQNTAPKATVSEIISGYENLISRAKARGIKIYFFGRTPFKGYTRDITSSTENDLEWTEEAENMLLEINNWLKNNKSHDGYIDIDKMRDEKDSAKLRDALTVDGVHFTQLGQIALTDLIPLEYFGLDSSKVRTSAQIHSVNPYRTSPTVTEPTTKGSQPTSENPTRPGETETDGTTEATTEETQPTDEFETEDVPVGNPDKNYTGPFANIFEIPGVYSGMTKKAKAGIIFFVAVGVCATAYASIYFVYRKKTNA